jgi:nitroreductase
MERVDEYIVASDSEEKRVRAGGFISHVDNKLEWAGKQAYLALGFAVAAATELKIATVVTEEFFPNNISDMLSLDSNYVPCVMLALGSSDGSEPSFKFPSSNLFEVLE